MTIDRGNEDPLYKRYRLPNGHGNSSHSTCKNHSVCLLCVYEQVLRKIHLGMDAVCRCTHSRMKFTGVGYTHTCIHACVIKNNKGQTHKAIARLSRQKICVSYPQSECKREKWQKSFVANPELSSLQKCKKAAFEIACFQSILVARSLSRCDTWCTGQGVLAVVMRNSLLRSLDSC